MAEMMEVKAIVRLYLTANGFDGLFNGDADCACLTDDLEPCGGMSSQCAAGYKAPCDCGEHDWHITVERP